MKQPIVVNAAVVGALIAVTASAWGMKVALSDAMWIPAPSVPTETTTRVMPLEAAAIPGQAVAARASEPLPSNAHVPAASEVREEAIVPRSAPQPPITVEQRRLTLDERIQANVMDALARAPDISGKVGVESRDAMVTLSGWTTTSGQARRAVRYAYGVEGVKEVQNEIRPRVGGSV